MVAGRIGEFLPHVEIALGGQDRFVPERQLDLFERRLATMGRFSNVRRRSSGTILISHYAA